MYLAVGFVREQVVCALVRMGAGIDSFRAGSRGSWTPAGDAIFEDNVPALSLCLKLGADLSCVCRIAGSPPKLCSGLEMAIGGAKHGPLIYLLDTVHMTRPVCLSGGELTALVTVASLGSPAKVVLEILKSRQFDFKSLEEMEGRLPDEIPHATSVADALLVCAQKSGAGDLMRYLVKDLGMVSTAGRMESLKNGVDKGYAKVFGDGDSRPLADLRKYKCAACEVVGATEFCSRCKVPRYCSKECQRSHWKTGGHKQECRIIQSRMHAKEVAKEGSPGAAELRNS